MFPSHTPGCAAADTVRHEPTADLIRTHCPTTELRGPLPGNSSEGHPFGTTLAPDEKRELIEFLKTL